MPNLHEFTILLKFTQQKGTSSVCENAKNEFPKKNTYYLENDQLKATIAGETLKINFIFEVDNMKPFSSIDLHLIKKT